MKILCVGYRDWAKEIYKNISCKKKVKNFIISIKKVFQKKYLN